MQTIDAAMGHKGDEISHTGRNTSVCFAENGYWFGDIMRDYALLANKECGWNYIIDGNERVQFARYGINQHYDWHVDTFTLSGLSRDRKISVVCLLTDPSEFKDGMLQFRLYDEFTPTLIKGSIIAFPSIIEHRVTPVSSGVRCTATMWLDGPRFR